MIKINSIIDNCSETDNMLKDLIWENVGKVRMTGEPQKIDMGQLQADIYSKKDKITVDIYIKK